MPTLIPTVSIGSSTFSKLPSDERRKYSKLGTLSCISLITNKMIGTGLFSTPSIIFKYCNGNVPLYLSLWLLGAVIIFSGLVIYLEFALNLPFKNGGEKNYLLRVFRVPKGLWGCIYAFQMVFLGFSSGNSFAFGKYLWFAISGEPTADDDWTSKSIGVLCITFCVWLHIKYPNQGTSLFNFLGVFKIFILFLIVAIGSLVAVNVIEVPGTSSPQPVLVQPSTSSFYSVSVALLEIVYSFKGWENANYVLLEVSDPYHVLTIAAPLAVALVTILYFLVVVSYLIVIPKDELLSSGVLVAGIFFNKIFGESVTSRLLPVLISLLTLGNVMVVSFAHSHVNQELAMNNYLPFSEYFKDINHSLVLHWAISVFILVGPPSSEIYEFVVNLYVYPGTWINVFISAGLIYLKFNSDKERWGHYSYFEDLEVFDTDIPAAVTPPRYLGSIGAQAASPTDSSSIQSFVPPTDDSYTEFDLLILETHSSHFRSSHQSFSAPWACVIIFLLANVFLALLPFFPPPKSAGPGALPYWCFPVVGTGSLLAGAAFFYLRAAYYKRNGKDAPLYEEEYNPEL